MIRKGIQKQWTGKWHRSCPKRFHVDHWMAINGGNVYADVDVMQKRNVLVMASIRYPLAFCGYRQSAMDLAIVQNFLDRFG